MATRKSQRIGIWIIAIAMVLGTIGGFAAMMVDPGGEIQQQLEEERAMADYQKQMEEAAKAHAESSKPLEGFEAAEFDAESVTELKVETLKHGDGATLAADSTISANYFGWTSDGKIFDSTNQNGEVSPAEFPLTGVIEGWTKGLTGVKVGSVVKLTIPSEQAYGEAGSPPNIGSNEPLQFIVEVVEKVEEA